MSKAAVFRHNYVVETNLSANAHGNGYADPNIYVSTALGSVQTDGGTFNVLEGNHALNIAKGCALEIPGERISTQRECVRLIPPVARTDDFGCPTRTSEEAVDGNRSVLAIYNPTDIAQLLRLALDVVERSFPNRSDDQFPRGKGLQK